MGSMNSQNITRADCEKVYNDHIRDHQQGYFKQLKKFADAMLPHVGCSPFSKEGWGKIIDNDGLYNKAKGIAMEMFHNDATLTKRFSRLLDNTRETANLVDRSGIGLEGWGGGNAIYASSLGAFAVGATPYIIGGWLATARSEEIFQHIDNNAKNEMRLEFEYNIDYLMVGDKKYYFPEAFRSGEIEGFNKLPLLDWDTYCRKANSGSFVAPPDDPWAGEHNFILLNSVNGAASQAKGNLLEVAGYNPHKNGIEPNCRFVAVKYLSNADDENSVVEKRTQINYHIGTGATNERHFKGEFELSNITVGGSTTNVKFSFYMRLSLDTGDFTLLTSSHDEATNHILKGIKLEARVSNIANEFTNIPTTGTDKYQFIRECEYRNYARISLNEYMADNFRIGSNNNISYAAYATDKMLQYVKYNKELEAEKYLLNDVLDPSVDMNSFELTRKMGGFINTSLQFTANRFAPGLDLQSYKEGLKTYLNKVLATAETDLNLPASVKREWILLGYDALITEFPEIKFENAAVTLQDTQANNKTENFGFSVDQTGYIDNLGRRVRLIGNNDSRWRDQAPNIYGTLRTFSMEYPFLVYYPHAIRMFTAIDPDNPNRTAIIIGGREFRGSFAAAAIKLQLNGVLDNQKIPVNFFENQVNDGKSGYTVKNL